MNESRFWFIVAIHILSLRVPLAAQESSRSDISVGIWTGVAWQNPTVFGEVTQRELFMAAIQLGRPVADLGPSTISWTLDLIPAMFIAAPEPPPSSPPCVGSCFFGAVSIPGLSGGRRIHGIGLAPIGIEWTWPVVGPMTFNLLSGAGVMRFAENTPHEAASRFNFMGQFGFGVGVATGGWGQGWGGYRFTHISNGSTADFNPGLDASVWFVGWRWGA
jgi:hypothetical protein